MLLRVFEVVQLGFRGSHEEDLTATLERDRNLVEEPMLVVRMMPDPQVLFIGVTMNVRARRMHERVLNFVSGDLEDASFPVIDPYDGVVHDVLLDPSSKH